MHFDFCLKNGKTRKVMPDKIRALSLLKSSVEAIETAKTIPVTLITSKTILRELYEGLREYCEGIGYLHGYKFLDHESISYFLRDVLNEESIYKKFDRYRKLRNGINYYGEDIDITTVNEAIIDIPRIKKELEKYSKTSKPQ